MLCCATTAAVAPVVELQIPSMRFKTGERTTWKGAMLYVRKIGARMLLSLRHI